MCLCRHANGKIQNSGKIARFGFLFGQIKIFWSKTNSKFRVFFARIWSPMAFSCAFAEVVADCMTYHVFLQYFPICYNFCKTTAKITQTPELRCNSLDMQTSQEGFYRPKIILDRLFVFVFVDTV